MLDNVLYSRSDRAYEVLSPNGDVAAVFPAGKDGRRQAFQAGVALQSPALYEFIASFVDKRPYLESRAWRAAELVLAGAVSETAAPNGVAEVDGRSEHGAYLIRDVSGVLVCDCLDYQELGAPFDEDGQPWCKHLIAYKAAQAA